MDKYKLHCTTEGLDVEVIASAVPTVCPNNAGHTIDSVSIRVICPDILVNDGTAKDLTLADYKQLRYNEIDYKSGVLISAGFTYDSNTFSLSANAQSNWNSLKNNTADFTWPKEVSTKDSSSYSLVEANVVAFWTAGKDVIEPILDNGRILKKSVFDAANKAAVDAVVDNR